MKQQITENEENLFFWKIIYPAVSSDLNIDNLYFKKNGKSKNV